MYARRRNSSFALSVFLLTFLVLAGESGIHGFPHESMTKENLDKAQNLVFIREMHMSLEQRSTEPLPEHLPLELTTSDGVYKVVLQKNRAADPANVRLVTKNNGKLEDMEPINSDLHGFYQDKESDAVIHVQVVKEADETKRHYKGSLRLGSKTYELHPMETTDKQRKDIEANHNIDTKDLHIHTLKSTNINHYRNARSILTQKRADRGNKAAYDKLLRDIDKMAAAEKKRGKGNGKENNQNNNGKLDGKIDEVVKPPDRPDIQLPNDNSNKDNNNDNSKIRTLLDLLLGTKAENNDHERRKRHVSANTARNQHYAMEIVLVVAYDIYQLWNDESALIVYILHLFNGVHMVYNRIDAAQHEFAIKAILREIVLVKSVNDDFIGTPNNDNYAVVNSQGDVDPSIIGENLYKDMRFKYSRYYWTNTDHVCYITNKWLSVWDDTDNDYVTAIGNAPTGAGCDPFYGWSVITCLGLTTWMTIAHEIAHSLGAYHDGYNGCTDVGYLMSFDEISVNDANVNNAFSFSYCSLRQMRGFLSGMIEGYGQNCFLDDPCDDTNVGVGKLSSPPGKVYGLNKQCQMYFNNPDAFYTKDCNTNNDICKHLSCKIPGIGCTSIANDGYKEIKAFMGTKCEGDKNKWCMLGKCSAKSFSKYNSMQNHCVKKRSFNTVPSNCLDSSVYDGECDVADNPDGNFASCFKTAAEENLPYDKYWCHRMAIDRPHVFYDYQAAVTVCRKNVHKFGLHFRFNNPCFSDGYDYVQCSDKGTTCVQYTKLCDGVDQCPSGEDEELSVCQTLSSEVPYCYDDDKVHCPKNFNRCIYPQVGCDGVNDCDDGEDEDADWCKNIPTAICPPGQTNSAANPSICVQ